MYKMTDQVITKTANRQSDKTKNLLRTAIAAAAVSIPLIHANTSDAAGFARRGGFRPAPAFHGNFHPQFRQNVHPQFRQNFHPQFRQNFHPQFRENFHPRFHDFDRGFRYNYNRDWNDRFRPWEGLNFNYGYNGYNVYQPYIYSYPSYSYPTYNYPSYAYSSPVYSYPVQTYTYPQVYIPQAQTYVPPDPPAAQTTVPYSLQASPAYMPQTASGPIILTYPNLQVIIPGKKTTLADVENMYATGRLTYGQEQRVISDMHLKPALIASNAESKNKNTAQPSGVAGDISSAKQLLDDGYITEKQYTEILAKKTLESDAAKMYANGSLTKAEYKVMLAKIKTIATNGQPGSTTPVQSQQSK